eukprot:TRINITY_DN72074_c0_g1_i1.p1 TRINITY_DN72074_c0_g1~~TRINITY_DN72074_c0_g1_i1.p1  ORF type:complete len:263 (-),score=43.36 TRINITY_DN72074_c0_g1_i1:130-918(-)
MQPAASASICINGVWAASRDHYEVLQRLDNLESVVSSLTKRIDGICNQLSRPAASAALGDLTQRVDRMELLLFRTSIHDFAAIDAELAKVRKASGLEAYPHPPSRQLGSGIRAGSSDAANIGMRCRTAGAASFTVDDGSHGALLVKDSTDSVASSLQPRTKGEDLPASQSDLPIVDKKLSVNGMDMYPTSGPEKVKPQVPAYLRRLPETARSWPPDCQLIQIMETDPEIRKRWSQHIGSSHREQNPSKFSEQTVLMFLSSLT